MLDPPLSPPSTLAEINFIFFAAGGTIYVDIKFNLKNINKVDVSFYKAKDTFGVTEYKGNVSNFIRQMCC